MEMPLPIGGSGLSGVVNLLKEDGLEKKKNTLFYQERPVFVLGRERFMPLVEDPLYSRDMLRWFYQEGREIRRARAEDTEEICALKEKSIKASFAFLDDQKREMLISKAASREYMAEEIAGNPFWVCLKEGEIWAVAGLKNEGGGAGLLYSGYSNGDRAVGALLSYRIYYAREIGLRRLYGRVYIENTWSARHLSRQGFQRLEGTFSGKYLPNYPLYHWALDL